MLKLMTKQMKNSNEKGFTLIELMIVVAIIGILAAIAIPQYQNFTKKSKASEAKVYLAAITTAQASYYAENDQFAATMSDLGNPDNGASYFVYTMAVTNTTATGASSGGAGASGAAYSVITTATPSTKGINAGLKNKWEMSYDGISGDKGVDFPPEGW